MWPNRAVGREPSANLAEVKAALSRRRRRQPAPPPQPPSKRRGYDPWHKGDGHPRQPHTGPLVHNGRKFTYAEAGRMCGVSAAAMFKRVRKFGWPAAMINAK